MCFLSFISATQIFNVPSNGELWQLPVYPLNYVSRETFQEHNRICNRTGTGVLNINSAHRCCVSSYYYFRLHIFISRN